jgi:thiol:disulfide interchange protein
MEKIQQPQALKTIAVWIINVLLFIVYYFLLSFFAGLVAGAVIMFTGSDYDTVVLNNPMVENLLVLAAFVATIVVTILARKSIYFHVVKSSDTVATTSAQAIDTTTQQ